MIVMIPEKSDEDEHESGRESTREYDRIRNDRIRVAYQPFPAIIWLS